MPAPRYWVALPICQSGVAEGLADRRVEIGRRRALDHFLVAPLDRAVAFEQVDEATVGVAQKLHFDVPGAPDELFQIDFILAEGRLGFAFAGLNGVEQLVLAFDRPHAPAAAAPGRLEHDRIADCRRQPFHFIRVVGKRFGRGHDWHANGDREIARGDLVAERAHGLRSGPDEEDAMVGAGFREFRALRQKAVTRMDRVDLCGNRDPDHLFDREIGLERSKMQFARSAPPDKIGLVRLEAVERELVLFGIDRHRLDSEFGRCAKHADRDLAAVGDEKPLNAARGRWMCIHLASSTFREAAGRPRTSSEWKPNRGVARGRSQTRKPASFHRLIAALRTEAMSAPVRNRARALGSSGVRGQSFQDSVLGHEQITTRSA